MNDGWHIVANHAKAVEQDAQRWRRELADAGWTEKYSMVWRAPCGCLFRGPYGAWTQMNGTHLADHIASGLSAT